MTIHDSESSAAVIRREVSPRVARYMKKYFVAPSNERSGSTFTRAHFDYDKSSRVMTVRAELKNSEDLSLGGVALSNAVRLAGDLAVY